MDDDDTVLMVTDWMKPGESLNDLDDIYLDHLTPFTGTSSTMHDELNQPLHGDKEDAEYETSINDKED